MWLVSSSVCMLYTCSCTVSFCEHMIIRVRVCAHSISLRIVSFDRAFHPWFSSSYNWSLMGLTHWVLTEWNRLWMASLNISAQPNVRSPCSRLRLSQHHHLAGCPRLWQESKKKKERMMDIKSMPDERGQLIHVHSAHTHLGGCECKCETSIRQWQIVIKPLSSTWRV